MHPSPLAGNADLQALRDLIAMLGPRSDVGDFEEQVQLPQVQDTIRLWRQGDAPVGFAYLDSYNNLWFETRPDFYPKSELEDGIVAWGMACMRRRNQSAGRQDSLDCSCRAEDHRRIELLARHGFIRQEVRSLRYARELAAPLPDFPPPAGFAIRVTTGRQEIAQLVALHRAAFGTDHMTVEERLAMIAAPGYLPELDLVVAAPSGELAAFCVCGFAGQDNQRGYTDPVGVHPRYRGLGLGKALLAAGLQQLKESGVQIAELGTSSENVAMQKLADELGFILLSERIWFSKVV